MKLNLTSSLTRTDDVYSLIAGGPDVHGTEDPHLHIHSGATGSDSGLPYARNTGTHNNRVKRSISRHILKSGHIHE